MAPKQVFPYDDGSGCLRPSSWHSLVDANRGKWGDPPAEVDDKDGLAFAPPPPLAVVSSQEACCSAQLQLQHSSDLHDALNDDDDDVDDGEGSVDLGSMWASGRDFVPKRGVEIFVGGLTRSTRRDMLRDWFQHAGEVTEVRIARDKRRRRCRGYGYVRFATSDQANRAIDTMHRFEFKHGRFLGVLPSDENRTLFVGGLREEWSCEYISQLLKEKMPGLRKIEPIPDREDRFKIRTFCFLEFESHADAAVIFNRHHTTPRPPPSPQQAATPHSPIDHPGLASLELLLPSSACGGAGAGKSAAAAASTGKGSGSVFFERDTRDRSTSTCTTSCASNGGGECCRIGTCDEGVDGVSGGGGLPSATTSTTAPPSASPDLRGSAALRFDGSGLWGREHLGLDDSHGGGGGGNGFGCWDEETIASATAADGGDSGVDHGAAGAVAGDRGDSAGDGEETRGAGTGGAVPLVVGGATLKVDWADPLRYHIHLNGGIKGPSASPEFGMPPDGRPCSRGGGGDRGDDDVGFPGGRREQAAGGAPGNGRTTGGVFGVGSRWQQHQHQRHQHQRRPPQEHQHQHQHEALVRRRSSLLSDPLSWQDGDHSAARMAHQGLRDHQQQQQQQQQRCLDVSRDRRPCPHLPHKGGGGYGVLRGVPTRERGYTIAAGYTAARRSPFDAADVRDGVGGDSRGGGGGSGRSVASPEHPGYADSRPRSKSSSQFHASLLASAAAGAGSSLEQRGCLDSRMAIASAPHHHRPPHHHRRGRLHPQQALATSGGGGSVGSQDLHPRTWDMAAGVPGVTRGGGMHNGTSSTQHDLHYHPRGGGGGGGGGLGRPYSASPDISGGRHGRRREVFSVDYGGDGNVDGDCGGNGTMLPSRSASCRPFSEQQQHPVGAGGGSSVLLSPSWERRALVEDNTTVHKGYSLGALDSPDVEWDDLTSAVPHSRGLRQRHMSSGALLGGQRSGTTTSVYDSHQSQRPRQQQQQEQQEQQRWERTGVCDRAADAPVMIKSPRQDRAPPPLEGGGGGDLSNSHHYSDDLSTFDRRFDQRQRTEQFPNMATAAPQPHARRHILSGELDLDLTVSVSGGGSSGQDNGSGSGGSDPPPGFLASHSHAVDDMWRGAAALLACPGSSGSGGMHATSAEAVEDGPAADMHLGARLRESMGAGGLDRHERSF
eukprot:g20485.t1